VLSKWDFVHANVVHLLRLADDALVPVAPAMRSVNYVQVIGDKLLVHTDRGRRRRNGGRSSPKAPTRCCR